MKHSFLSLAVISLTALASQASTLECKIYGINDLQSTIKVTLSTAMQKVGTMGGDPILMSEENGFVNIQLAGSSAISIGSKSHDIYLSNEGFSIDCQDANNSN